MAIKCGVYLIVSPSNRRYIGSSANIYDRWAQYKRLECEKQIGLYRSLKKYGANNHVFKIVYECKPEDRLSFERIFGDLYLSLSDFGGLNHKLPQIDDRPIICSSELKNKLSTIFKKLRGNEEYKRLNKERVKKGMANPEVRRKISEGLKKYHQNNIQAERAKRAERKKGCKRKSRKYSDERKELQKVNQINYHIKNPEAKKKFLEIVKIKPTKKVFNINTNEIYQSPKIVAEILGMNVNTFRCRLNGKMKNNTAFRYL